MRYIKTAIIAALAWGSGMYGYYTGFLFEGLSDQSVDLRTLITILIPASLAFGILIAAFQSYIDRRRRKQGIDIDADQLRPVDSVVVNLTLIAARRETELTLLALHGAKIRSASEDHFEIRTSVTKRSWGEIVRVELKPVEDEKTLVQVSSRPWFKLTIIDYGQNSDNVREVLTSLSQGSEKAIVDSRG